MLDNNNIHVLSRAVIIDNEHILLCNTLDLANNFYFLPGGHVEYKESAESSLLRELKEESGADCVIKRFLGCLEHSFIPRHSSICHDHEYNFVYEVESDILKHDYIVPQLEKHIKLVWVALHELNKIDFRAEVLRKLIPQWMAGSNNNSFKSFMV